MAGHSLTAPAVVAATRYYPPGGGGGRRCSPDVALTGGPSVKKSCLRCFRGICRVPDTHKPPRISWVYVPSEIVPPQPAGRA